MNLAKLESVDIRSQWKREERDFTPWLAQEENIQVLGDALGLELEVEGTEVAIGSFEADIVARDADGRRVIIENQLNRTDHKHFGQLLTYAAGLEAKIVIWVCAEIADEHRQALDWLNEQTAEDVAFFACEIELWRIDGSRPAPRFKVVSSPNQWSKVVRSRAADGPLTPAKSLHLEFWTAFKGHCESKNSFLRLRTPRPQHWYSLSIGRSGFQISLTANTQLKRVGCEIYIRGGNAKRAFAALAEHTDELESRLGTLQWQELPEGQDCRIVLYREGDPGRRDAWQDLHEWLRTTAEAFHNGFGPLIKALAFDDDTAS